MATIAVQREVDTCEISSFRDEFMAKGLENSEAGFKELSDFLNE